MPKGRVALLVTLAVLAIIETVGIFTGSDTISALTADVFRASTETGRLIFGLVWVVFSGWYLAHVWHFKRTEAKAARAYASMIGDDLPPGELLAQQRRLSGDRPPGA